MPEIPNREFNGMGEEPRLERLGLSIQQSQCRRVATLTGKTSLDSFIDSSVYLIYSKKRSIRDIYTSKFETSILAKNMILNHNIRLLIKS